MLQHQSYLYSSHFINSRLTSVIAYEPRCLSIKLLLARLQFNARDTKRQILARVNVSDYSTVALPRQRKICHSTFLWRAISQLLCATN